MIYPIRYFGDPVLRSRALPVRRFDDALRELARDMVDTMYDANGIGLAAPQIGIPKRLFVALEIDPERDQDSGQEHDPDGREEPPPEDETPDQKRRRWGVLAEHVLVNPEIVERGGVQYGQDGCLSVPGLYVDEIRRDLRVRVRYQDVHGGAHELDAEGHFAHVLQHEHDHLEGILFFDRLPDEERKVFLEENRAELAELQREAKALLKELKRNPLAVAVE